MPRKILILVGGFLTIAWGTAHMFPTNSVVKGFGNISTDNTLVITMEWINEGMTLIFIGLLVIAVTVFGDITSKVVKIVYLLASLMLFAMAVLSVFTGFKIHFLPYQLCPFIFSLSGILILQGILYKKDKPFSSRTINNKWK